MPVLNAILEQRLAKAGESALKRELVQQFHEVGPFVTRAGKRYLHFSGNDYLALSRHPDVVRAAAASLDAGGTGSTGSRLVTGNHAHYKGFEEALAAYKGTEAALVFGSGYLANTGAIASLVEEGDLILADKLIHACMIDGARLSGATLKRFAHNDMAHLEALLKEHRGTYRHCLVLTESVFSMDGDRAPLDALRGLTLSHDAWLMVDDAHGLGFVHTIPADIISGTLSKALGGYGGYVAGSRVLVDYLVNHARSFIFSTGLPPATIAASHEALAILRNEPERALSVLAEAKRVTGALALPEAQSPIVPLVIGSSEAALAASRMLEEEGVWVQAIRPPTVPPNTARLRITLTAHHEPAHVDRLIDAVRRITSKA